MDKLWIDFLVNKIASTQHVDNPSPDVYNEMGKEKAEKFLTNPHTIILLFLIS
ncbi:MAG: hypothetical protein PUC35_03595 [Prevotellaceae bacterium]|nr:hypothetical protein [Prevotellaceae bacterium]